jgi:hypothetical protein
MVATSQARARCKTDEEALREVKTRKSGSCEVIPACRTASTRVVKNCLSNATELSFHRVTSGATIRHVPLEGTGARHPPFAQVNYKHTVIQFANGSRFPEPCELAMPIAMSTLVIVESPAKAKTIAGYLGKGYDVQASFGHVRDLPERADEVPLELKKAKWAKLGVNVEGSFEPLYIVPEDKKRHVAVLRAAAKDADALLLATDEDREGESISWHILQLLKLGKKQTVKRIVFHEITPEAIREAINSPRDIDESLVRAQETRRIVDRLYGYTLSPVLWKKVAPKLSAGRVQSVAVRLLVERERERKAFHNATYWDLDAALVSEGEAAQVKSL